MANAAGIWLGSLALVCSSTLAAAQPERVSGVLTDPVVSASDPTQRYVLYLPPGLNDEKPAPVLFIMDYRGRGRRAADLFIPTAERLGWIVASSYNTASDRDGQPNVAAVRAMWNDLRDRVPLDDRRLYLAGLSGTARMATVLALKSGVKFRGVIGAAAGFDPSAPPTRETPFLYFGTAGTIDYNYWEMRLLEQRLTALGIPHRIAFFDGPHGWMPPDLAEAAMIWMELRAMRDGLRPIDEALVEQRWVRDLDRARALERDGGAWEAARLLSAIAADYTGLRPPPATAEALRLSRALRATKAAEDQARAHDRAAKIHDARVQRALQVIAEAFPAAASEPRQTVAATILDLDITRLRATAAEKTEAGLAAARILAELNVQTGFYLPAAALQGGDDLRAAFYLGIAEAIDPDDSYAWYLRAAVAARRGSVKEAVAALNRALSLGFMTADLVEHDRSFDAIRGRPEFAAVLDRLRASAARGLR